MRASILTWAVLGVCLLGAAANAFFYLADPNYPPVFVDSAWIWTPVLWIAGVYGGLGLLAWSQRRDLAATGIVLTACLLAVVLLLMGRGADWYGSVTIPNYYNQAMRFASAAGGIGQTACLLLAGVGVLAIRVARRFGSNRQLGAEPGAAPDRGRR